MMDPDKIGLWGALLVLVIDKIFGWFNNNAGALVEIKINVAKLSSDVNSIDKRLERIENK